ncbi:energy transducer TonB [Desulfurobacterium atlanticum]|uniref:Protein TonB n=1 Tax=Desulfurobacterium atlanticum TaxID=240169 RepID=A0A238YJE3_9BACT|nr:TonB family protein [Desulfurobacterium atlanticum]SNR70831.1 protein TonB [Desulfurobacterium atlanticum]
MESFEKNYRKLDIFAFTVSLVIHIFILTFFQIKNTVFKTSEFEVVDFNAFSLDTEVESNLIALKSNPGKSTTTSGENYKVEIPRGMKIKRSGKGETKKSITFPVKRKGLSKAIPAPKTGRKDAISSKRVNNRATGNARYTFSISDSAGEKEKSSFSDLKVKGSPIAEYALQIKRKIMENWQNPYTNSNKKLLVELSFTLDKNGKLTSFNIEKLSEDSLFNDSAINAIYSSAPFPPFPEELRNLNSLTLKVKFEVK